MNFEKLNINTTSIEELNESFNSPPVDIKNTEEEGMVAPDYLQEVANENQENKASTPPPNESLLETAEGIVYAFDKLAAFSLGKFVAKSDKYEKYQLSEKDKKYLSETLVKTMPQRLAKTSPEFQLVFILIGLYSGLYNKASSDRIINEQKNEIEALKLKIQFQKLKDKVHESEFDETKENIEQ